MPTSDVKDSGGFRRPAAARGPFGWGARASSWG